MFIKEQHSIVVPRKCWGCDPNFDAFCQYFDQWIRTLLNPLSTYHGTVSSSVIEMFKTATP